MFLREAGVDISTIALWLGHEQITTVQIYLHADLRSRRRHSRWLHHLGCPRSLPTVGPAPRVPVVSVIMPNRPATLRIRNGITARTRHNPLFGITPKSVSVLWEPATKSSAQRRRRARTRVASTLDFLQDHAAFTRRGAGGSSRSTPRALSPRASSTALRAPRNRSCIATSLCQQGARRGRQVAQPGWSRALRAPEGRRHALSRGASGRAHRLAWVSWTPVDENGIAEIQGVPRCSSRPGRRVATKWSP